MNKDLIRTTYLSGRQVNAVVLIGFSFSCIVYIYLKDDYHDIYVYTICIKYDIFKFVFEYNILYLKPPYL